MNSPATPKARSELAASPGWLSPARWRRRRNALPASGRIGLALVLFWALLALLGPWVIPHPPGAVVSTTVFAPMSLRFPLGTDYLGRDMLSRILIGARYTVGLALAAAVAASATGTVLGLLAAISGRWVDELLSRLLDALICIPSMIFALIMVAVFGSSLPILLLTAALGYVAGAFRIARSLAVNLSVSDYVEAARVRGEGRLHIACVEILPNMVHPMLADFGLRFMFIVLMLSGLSFLGLGVQPPAADLGSLIRENLSGLGDGAAAVLLPAIAVATLTIGVNLLIDGLADHGRPEGGGGKA
ncbi:MAG: ABC transporter permease [Proteobacteria bacterium]|nr:ABC transporter permease [Pseudomonadota bacterium]